MAEINDTQMFWWDDSIDGDEVSGEYVPTKIGDDIEGKELREFSTPEEAEQASLLRARVNSVVAEGKNPEKEQAALTLAREEAVPLALARELDNRAMRRDDLKRVSPEAIQFLSENTSNAIIAKGDVKKLDRALVAAGFISRDDLYRRDMLAQQIGANGYTREQRAELFREGYTQVPGLPNVWVKNGQTVKNPVLPSWVGEPGEAAVDSDMGVVEKTVAEYVSPQTYERVRGTAWLERASVGTAPKYIRHLMTEYAVVCELYSRYGELWKGFDDTDLNTAIGEAGAALGLDVRNIVPDRFREVSVGTETNWAAVSNVLGIRDIRKAVTGLSPEELLAVAKSPEDFSLDQQKEVISAYEELLRAARGNSWGNTVAEGVAGSIPFSLEFVLFGGTSTAALKGASFATRAAAMAKATAKLVLASTPGNVAKSVNAVSPQLTVERKGDGVVPGLTERNVDDYGAELYNATLTTGIEAFTEMVGGLLPGGSVLSRFVPKRLANSAIGRMVSRLVNSKVLAKASAGAEKMGFHGFVPELGEEYLADVLRGVSTGVSDVFGTRYGDLEQRSLFGSPEEEAARMATVAMTGVALKSLQLPSTVDTWRRTRRFAEGFRALNRAVAATETKNRDALTVEHALRLRLGDKGTGYVEPSVALALFQSNPEVMRAVGLGEDVIAEAEQKGQIIPVDMASVVTRLEGAEFESVLKAVMPSPKHLLSVEEVEGIVADAESEKGVKAAEADIQRATIDNARNNLLRVAPEKLDELLQKLVEEAPEINVDMVRRYIEDPASVTEYDQAELALALQAVDTASRVVLDTAENLFQGGEPIVPMEGLAEDTVSVQASGQDTSSHTGHALADTVIDATRKDAETRADFKRAYNDAIGQLMKLGRPAHEIRAAARFLSMANYFARHTTNGMTAADWIRNVAFQKMKETDWLREFNEGVTADGRRGVTTFNEKWEAMITLFDGAADGSTLVHELGHYAFETMRHFVESGIADKRMVEDFRVLENWAKLTSKEADIGYGKYLANIKEKHANVVPASKEAWVSREEKERLARGFEAYVMRGETASPELVGAFATMRHILRKIYECVKSLGVKLNDDVRRVFDGMLTVDEAAERDSLVVAAIAGINKELLGLTQEEIRTYSALIGKSHEQTISALIAERDRQLRELRPQWREEAKAYMAGDPVYVALAAVEQEGGLDYGQLAAEFGEETAKALRKKAIAAPKKGSGKDIYAFWRAAGFQSVEQMGVELLNYTKPSEFIREYMALAEETFNAEFEASEESVATLAAVDMMDNLVASLNAKTGANGRAALADRRKALEAAVRRDIKAMSVSQIMSDKKLIGSSRMSLRDVTKALTKNDYIGALDAATKLRYNIELMRQKGAAKQTIQKLVALFKRGLAAKSIDGSFKDAIVDLAKRLGLTTRSSRGATLRQVIQKYNEEAEGMVGLDVPDGLLDDVVPLRQLSFGDAEQTYRLLQFLYGRGKDIVSEAEEARKQEQRETMQAAVNEMASQKHTHVKGLVSWANVVDTVSAPGTKLRNLFGKAGQWSPDSVFSKMYDELVLMAGKQDQLMSEPNKVIGECLSALRRNAKRWNLNAISSIKFPAVAVAEGYVKWDVEKVLMTCLNLGCETNRKRLISGFGWQESDLERISALLSAEDWANVQRIWDAIGKGKLAEEVRNTFRRIYYFDMSQEEARPFATLTSEGETIEVEGGYFPLAYLVRTKRSEKTAADEMSQSSPPAFRRATFTYDRVDNVTDPVDLSLRRLHQHVFDTSHFVTHAEAMRKLLNVVSHPDFRREFTTTQGFARYKALAGLLKNVAAPGEWMRGEISKVEKWLRASFTAAALWGNPRTVLKQLASATVGADELGEYFFRGWREFSFGTNKAAVDFIRSRSAMMRNRAGRMDIDTKTLAVSFNDGPVKEGLKKLHDAGYFLMKRADWLVVAPAWLGAYYQAYESSEEKDETRRESEAAAKADEFVAKTQGADRALDLSYAQLTSVGRALTVFMGPSSAAATMAAKTIDKAIHGEVDLPAIVWTVIAPTAFSALIVALMNVDPDDPDRAQKSFWREMLTSPFSGVPYIGMAEEGVVDWSLAKIFSGKKPYRDGAFDAPVLGFASDTFAAVMEAVDSSLQGNGARTTYLMADVASQLAGVPLVKAYDRIQQQLDRWGADGVLIDLDDETKNKKSRQKRQYKWRKK